jgi:Galactose oxidase, central domain
MKTPDVNLIPQSPLRLGFLLIPLALGCFALSPAALAVTPARDGGYANQNTAEDEDALFSLTTGAANTAMGFDVLGSNTTGSDNALASWSWRVTHSLNTARSGHTATLLQNGMVLVAGGSDSNFNRSASAELYDLASGTWTATGSLNTARNMHTATLLQNGMVLVAGGVDSNIIISATAELYDPTSGTWTFTGSLNTARAGHTATLLQNGMVLVAGGEDSNFDPSASAELGHGHR